MHPRMYRHDIHRPGQANDARVLGSYSYFYMKSCSKSLSYDRASFEARIIVCVHGACILLGFWHANLNLNRVIIDQCIFKL